jgi:ribulose-phosphate 3-epimerase
MAHIFPSLTAANQLNLQHDIQLLEPYCKGFHLDIMDNHFVATITWGAATVNAIAKITNRTLWVHLMVDNPVLCMEDLTIPTNSLITFHIESNSEIKKTIARIREKNWLPGIALNPKTPVEKIFPFLSSLHHVTIMSVEPGFSGQDFLPSVIDKINDLTGYRQASKLPLIIAMDGGINEHNIASLTNQGVNLFGVGSAIFGKQDPLSALKQLQTLAA